MKKSTKTDKASNLIQLKKYAQDLSAVYKSEKEKRKELEDSHKQLLKYAEALNKANLELKERNKEIREAYIDTIHRLVLATEFREENTGKHIMRLSRFSVLMAQKSGLSDKEVQNIFYATPMHDVGKVGIPDKILLKPGKLTKEEFDCMKTHTTIGAKILSDSKADIIQIAKKIALSHHEKWNSTGYPEGLSGTHIPLEGRIVGLVDVFDALTSKRPYKNPYPLDIALEIIKKERGKHFDPDIVDIFLDNFPEIKRIKNEISTMSETDKSDFIWSERDLSENKHRTNDQHNLF